MQSTDVTTKQIFRGEVLKELDKYQGESIKVNVLKKAFAPSEGLPISKFKGVLNYLKDKKMIEWEKKDISNPDDDLIRITADGQDIVDCVLSDPGIII